MNLEEFEKISIQESINREIEKLIKEQKQFKLNSTTSRLRKKAI
tara:strand:+ start:40866 stop:40997 length:132 start_codon:yes stop_codon:yes gene_type:complete